MDAEARVAPHDPGEEARILREAPRAVVDVPAVRAADRAPVRIAGGPEGNAVGDGHDHADARPTEAGGGVVEVAQQALVMPATRGRLDSVPADVHPDPGDVGGLEQPELVIDVRARDAVGELGVYARLSGARGGEEGEERDEGDQGRTRQQRPPA